MRIGYARVSTADQHLDLQQDALRQAGCEKIVVDRVSETVADRPGLARVRDMLRPGYMLVVWRLDRLGRSIRDFIEWVTSLERQGIGFQSLQEAIETSSPIGKLTFHIFAALAEFERHLIRERTHAGLAAARARDRKGGRPKALDADQRHLVVTLYHEKKLPVKTICAMMGISKPTLYAYVRGNSAS